MKNRCRGCFALIKYSKNGWGRVKCNLGFFGEESESVLNRPNKRVLKAQKSCAGEKLSK